MTSATFDVAIIGAGPVGTALANFLGLAGVRTILLDRQSEAYHLPRAVAFDDEAMRMFQVLGLADAVAEIAQPGLGAKFLDADGKVLVHWERPLKRTENGWYLNYRFHQPTLERILRSALQRFDCVETRWQTEVAALSQDEDGVDLALNGPDGADNLRARYVVGCDGGRSFTRHAIGAGNEDLGFHEDWLIVDFVLPAPEANPDRYTYHYCGTPRMGSKVFVGDRRKRWEFRLNDDDDRATIGTPDEVWPLVAGWITPDDATLERTAVYTFHSTLAESWRKGRVLIAGDAAHQTPPFMAQGMCAGLRDAGNLGWKLARVLQDAAPDALLDSYQSERRPHVREYIDLTIGMGEVINHTRARISGDTVADAAGGGQRMSQIRPILGPGVSAGDTGLRGHLFPQFDLDETGDFDDLTGYGLVLVLAATATLPPALAGEFEAAGIDLFHSTDNAIERWMAEAGCAAVMVRPDKAILGHVGDASQLEELLPKRWRYGG